MRRLRLFLMPYIFYTYKIIFLIFRLLPVKNKVVATTMRGRKYSDNPRFIIEALHQVRPDLDIVWFIDERYNYSTPDWIRRVPYYGFGMLKRIYEMATAKIWVNSHLWEFFVSKKHCQLFIETDHGSMPIKKVNVDLNKSIDKGSIAYKELENTAHMADVFLANSQWHEQFYHRAYIYNGKVWRCGYPRNDELVRPTQNYKNIVCKNLGLTSNMKLFLYAPTFRDSFEKTHVIDYSVYNVNFESLNKVLHDKFGGEWMILVKFHPIMQLYINDDQYQYFKLPYVRNVSDYSNMQELISASDFLLTDYSSCVFDAAIAGIPGMLLCLDYDTYKQDRDVYFSPEDLPFPFAQSNEAFLRNVVDFSMNKYMNDWNIFKEKLGLDEPGNAADNVVKKICQFIDKGKVYWE